MSEPVIAGYQRQFVEALASALGMPVADIDAMVKPAEPQHGDFSFPTFALAKAQKKAPPAIANALAAQLSVPGLRVAAAGPYVNARVDSSALTLAVIGATRKEGEAYGGSTSGLGQTVVIDYSSPNIAKPIAFHHIRSTMIGHALTNLYRAHGWKVEGINYLGDWGKQFGLVAVGFQAFGDPAKRHDVGHLVEVYVKANERAAADPEFDALARGFFRKMEEGDVAALALWREFREASLVEFRAIYQRLGIVFEHYEGESDYQNKMDAVVAAIQATIGTKESEGALIVDMPYENDEPPVLLKKSDGSTLYATRDLAAAIDRHNRFSFNRALYVVATDQSLHFRQFFEVLRRMGKPWASQLVHVNFGRVHGMSTRKGQIRLLADVLDEARNRASEKVAENIAAGRIQTSDAAKLAEQIGVGAIVFGDLKNRRATDYTFDWEEVLSLEGHTGAYLQYAHARACKLLEKGDFRVGPFDSTLLSLPEEEAVVRSVARFPVVTQDALEANEPSLLARHLLDLAACFSRWYTLGNQDRTKRVLSDDEPATKTARLALVDSVRVALENGLQLLGIAAPTQM